MRPARRTLGAPGWALALTLAACGGEGDEQGAQGSKPDARGAAAAVDFELLDTGASRRRAADAQRWRDPRRDGWDTEALAALLDEQLHVLGDWIAHPDGRDELDLEALGVAGLTLRPLRPALVVDYEDAELRVLRAAAGTASEPVAFQAAVESLTATLLPSGAGKTKFKIVRVEPDSDGGAITLYYELRMPTTEGRVEQHATWTMRWRRQEDGAPLLAAAEVLRHEESHARAPNGALLADCTAAVLGADPCFASQLARGLDHWARHVEEVHGMGLYRHWGAAVADVDGDGLEDVYLCQTAGLPNRLFLQNPDGTARDVAAAAGVDVLDHSSSALLVDLDEDGDTDLALATHHAVLVYAQGSSEGGEAAFELAATLTSRDKDVYGLSAADFDLDGDLDLYVTVDFAVKAKDQSGSRVRFNYVDANDGGANRLFRNDLDAGTPFAFTDVTEEVGLGVLNSRHSLAAAWEDFDRDGDLDLYVANDYGQNCLYRNDAGHFVEVAAELGVTDHGSGMSAHWGDFDRDGRTDLYVANMFSSAGNRITTQPQFMEDVDEATRALYRRFAKGNTLFAQQPDGTFAEVSGEAGVEMGRWAWSSLFADVNNDGWDDLLVANGYITTEDTADL